MIYESIAIIAKKAMRINKKRFLPTGKSNRKMTCKRPPLYLNKPLVKHVKISKDVEYV